MSSPVDGIPMQITQGGDWRDTRFYNGVQYEHEGIDLRAVDSNRNPVNILCSAPGVVDYIRNFDPGTGYGKYIRVRHDYGDDTYFTWYCHLSYIGNLDLGEPVQRDQALGIAGSTGNSTGIHLHYGAEHLGHGEPGNFIRGDWINPKLLLGIS